MKQIRVVLRRRVKDPLRNLWWCLIGRRYRNPPMPAHVASVTFICKGNICRSAYAHRCLDRLLLLEQYPASVPPLQVASVGLAARPGNRSPETAVDVARRLGIDLEPHRATPMTAESAERSGMLIAMEPGQVRQLRRTYPQCRDRIFLMAAFEPGWERRYNAWQQYHIQDPYGRDAEQFMECFQRLERCLDGLQKLLIGQQKGCES